MEKNGEHKYKKVVEETLSPSTGRTEPKNASSSINSNQSNNSNSSRGDTVRRKPAKMETRHAIYSSNLRNHSYLIRQFLLKRSALFLLQYLLLKLCSSDVNKCLEHIKIKVQHNCFRSGSGFSFRSEYFLFSIKYS